MCAHISCLYPVWCRSAASATRTQGCRAAFASRSSAPDSPQCPSRTRCPHAGGEHAYVRARLYNCGLYPRDRYTSAVGPAQSSPQTMATSPATSRRPPPSRPPSPPPSLPPHVPISAYPSSSTFCRQPRCAHASSGSMLTPQRSSHHNSASRPSSGAPPLPASPSSRASRG